jgi:hypothetical protein
MLSLIPGDGVIYSLLFVNLYTLSFATPSHNLIWNNYLFIKLSPSLKIRIISLYWAICTQQMAQYWSIVK